MRKRSLLCLLLVLLFVLPAPLAALADESDMNRKVLAPSFIVFEADDPETFIYAKNPDKKILPASTTKIMTCILALEHCEDLEQLVTVPDSATRLKSTHTLMGLKKGEVLPMRELLYGLMLPSGNDAAIAIACHISGSVEAFAELMNEKAAELGMENSHFTNASGVYNSGHYSTARDMARLSSYALKNNMFREIVGTAEYIVPPNEARDYALELINTNRLVSDPETSKYYYEYAIGCKTGSTEKGGKCLVAAAEKDGVTLVAVLLGVKEGGDKSERIRRCFSDSKMMFEQIYETMYAPHTAEELGVSTVTTEVQVENPRLTDEADGLLTLTADFSGQSVSLRDTVAEALLADTEALETDIKLIEGPIEAPVAAGDVLGTVTVSHKGRTLFTADLTADRAVEVYDPADEPTPTPAPTAAPTLTPTPAAAAAGIPLPLIIAAALFMLLMIVLIALIVRLKKR